MVSAAEFITEKSHELLAHDLKEKQAKADADKRLAVFIKDSLFYKEVFAGLELFKSLPGAHFVIETGEHTADFEIYRSTKKQRSENELPIVLQIKDLHEYGLGGRVSISYEFDKLFDIKFRPVAILKDILGIEEYKPEFYLVSDNRQIKLAHKMLAAIAKGMTACKMVDPFVAEAAAEYIQAHYERPNLPLSAAAKDGIAALQAQESLQGTQPDAQNHPG
jgi:hypothetical protein